MAQRLRRIARSPAAYLVAAVGVTWLFCWPAAFVSSEDQELARLLQYAVGAGLLAATAAGARRTPPVIV